jgi:crossover junction endodeoxyribonuclease RuvC
MKIIGIDPGLTKTGIGIIEIKNNQLLFIHSNTIYTDSSQPISTRLIKFYQELTLIIKTYQPQISAIEETFVNKNPLSSLKLGHARGALILTLAMSYLPVFEYSSTQIKKTITGVGRAEKHQIQAMIKILLPKANFKNEDEADALAVAICHYHQQRKY